MAAIKYGREYGRDAAGRKCMIKERPVGICPACGEAVFNSREAPDGPVWTCRSDLHQENPFHEELPEDWQTSEEEKNRMGYFANCPDGWPEPAVCPMKHDPWHGHMPLHSKCYDGGDY